MIFLRSCWGGAGSKPGGYTPPGSAAPVCPEDGAGEADGSKHVGQRIGDSTMVVLSEYAEVVIARK